MKKIIVILFILTVSVAFPLHPQKILISDGAWKHSAPAVAYNESKFQVVWSDNRYNDWRYYGTQIECDGTVGDEYIMVGPSTNIYQETEMCSNGNEFMMVWFRYQTTGCPSYIYGQLIESSGVPSGSYFRIDLSNYGIVSVNPKICSDGTDFICVWTQGSFPFFKPVGQLIESDGTFINENFNIDDQINTYSNPCIAFDGVHYLCVWNTVIDGSICIKGSLLTPDGVLFGNELQITSSTNQLNNAAIVFGGSEYLIVWEEYSFSTNLSRIYGQFISTDCSLISNPFLISGSGEISARNPKISSTGHSYLVTWQQDNADGTHNLRGQLLDLCGTLYGDVFDIIVDYQELVIHYSACNSENKYFVVWEEEQADQVSFIKGLFIEDIPVSTDSHHEFHKGFIISPNPSHKSFNIRFNISEPQKVILEMYNIIGQKIDTLYEGFVSNGRHELFYETNVSSGIYFIKMQTESEIRSDKLIIMK